MSNFEKLISISSLDDLLSKIKFPTPEKVFFSLFNIFKSIVNKFNCVFPEIFKLSLPTKNLFIYNSEEDKIPFKE